MQNNNPYAAPQSNLNQPQNEDEFALLDEPRRCDAGAGWRWITDAWSFFKAEPLLWIVMMVVMSILLIVLSAIPIISLLVGFIMTFFIAGVVIGCDEQMRGGNLRFDHLFAGFQTNAGQLLLLSVIYLVGGILAFIPGFLIIGAAFIPMMLSGGDPSSIAEGASMITLALGALVMLAIYFIVLMAYWFAPALVALHNVPAIDAMKLSFKACLRNIVPFLIFGIMLFLLMIVATIPLGLGWLVLLPVLMISYYTSYRHVLTVDEPQ